MWREVIAFSCHNNSKNVRPLCGQNEGYFFFYFKTGNHCALNDKSMQSAWNKAYEASSSLWVLRVLQFDWQKSQAIDNIRQSFRQFNLLFATGNELVKPGECCKTAGTENYINDS